MSTAPVIDVARGVVAGFHCSSAGGTACAGRQLGAALTLRTTRPAATFVSIAVEWPTLSEPDTEALLREAGSLSGVVLDITGLRPSSPAGEAERTTAAIQEAGAAIALHAAELWKPGFVWWMRLRPSFIALDAEWTEGIRTASRREFAVEAVGRIAAQADARLVAAHVGTVTEFDAVAEMGVPLARGPFVGAAVEVDDPIEWPSLSPDVLRALRPLHETDPGPLRDLLDRAVVVETLLEARLQHARDAITPVVLVDQDGRARWLTSLTPDGDVVRHELLRLNVDTPPADAVPRALSRPDELRADPVAAVDNAGRFLGLVSMSRLVALGSATGTTPPDLYAAWSTIVDALPRV